MHTLSLCAVAALAALVNAQSVTLPQGYAAKEGLSSRHVPLRHNSARIQSGFGAKATGWTRPRVIRELWARADGNAYLNTAFSADLQVWLSSDGCDPEVLSMVFDANHGRDKILWMKRKRYSFQPFQRTTKPTKWTIQLKGDRVFVAVKPTLVVDWASYSSRVQYNASFFVDATNLSGSASGTRGTVTYYGTGCPTTFYNYATGINEGELLRTYGYSRNLSDLVLTWVGAGRTNIPIGGGCSIYTAPVLFHPVPVVTTATTGYANFDWAKLPPGIKGLRFWTQIVAFDPARTRIRTSRGAEVTIGDYRMNYPFKVGHKYGYASGSRNFDPDKDKATYGWVRTAIIFEVR